MHTITGTEEDSIFARYALHHLNYHKPNLGFELSGGYLHNIVGSILEDDGSLYQNRAQAGLDWNLMRGGLQENKDKYEIERLDIQIDSLRNIERDDLKLYAGVFDYIIYLFNVQKIQLINRYQQLLDKELEVAYQLYYLRYIHWEEVLEIMSRKAEMDIVSQNFREYNHRVDLPFDLNKTPLGRLPLLQIDLDSIQSIQMDSSIAFDITEKQIEKERLQHKWKFNPAFKTYLRYNYYNFSENAPLNRDFAGAGVQVKIPIAAKKKKLTNRLEAKHEWKLLQNEQFHDNLKNELLNHCYEYEYKHRQFIQFYYKKLLAINQINRELTKRDLSDLVIAPLK